MFVVKFDNGEYIREIGIAKNNDEISVIIAQFLKERNYKSYYTRTWTENGVTKYDVGSHTQFFYSEEIKMKKFSIPVNWEVWDKVDIEAETIEEAVKYIKENIDIIPLGTEPEYIDGSYRIDDGENGEASVEDTVRFLRSYWDLSDGISGVDL